MKTYFPKPLAALAISTLVGATSLSGATSGVVGAVNITVPGGTSTILSNPFQHPVEFQSTVTAVSGNDVTVDGSLPTLSGPHYIQVMSGAEAGMVYTIDSYTPSAVTLMEQPSGLAVDDTVAIRKHLTLAELDVPSGVTVTLLNGEDDPTIATLFLGSWTVDAENTVIYPGEGFVINSGEQFEMTLLGSVSEDDVVYEMESGSYVIGSLDPIDGTESIFTDIEGLPGGITLTELDASGDPLIYTKFLGSWLSDPSNIDFENLKSIVINVGGETNITMPGNVISE